MVLPRTLALARFSQLLRTIETSSKALRELLEKEGRNAVKDHQLAGRATQIADKLGLPFHANMQMVEEASVLRVACERLARLVTAPRHLLFETAGAYLTTTSLKIALKHDIATRIHMTAKAENREGVHIETLAQQCKLDADALGRTLRYLSVRGIFQEIEPGVFGNTTASSTLVNNPEFVAHLNVIMQDVGRGAPYHEEFMKQRFANSGSNKPTPAPFTLSTGGVPWYSWLHSKEHEDRGKLFDQAMRGMTKTEGLEFIPLDYPFNSFPEDTLIVDVGGGIGSLAELILSSTPHLRYVVQDLGSTIELAREIATPAMKTWMGEGKLRFQTHDGFVPQPPEHQGAVFILKTMIHNWPDIKAVEILRTLRKSNPLKLLVIDRMVRPHLRTEAHTEEGEADIYRPLRKEVPRKEPFGSQGVPTEYDLVMSLTHGSKTRLYEEWVNLFTKGGFRLSGVYPLRASTGQAVMEAEPIDD